MQCIVTPSTPANFSPVSPVTICVEFCKTMFLRLSPPAQIVADFRRKSIDINCESTPFQKSNVTRLQSIRPILICLWVCIPRVRYHLKACLFCLVIDTCRNVRNWVQCQQINLAKLDHNFNR